MLVLNETEEEMELVLDLHAGHASSRLLLWGSAPAWPAWPCCSIWACDPGHRELCEQCSDRLEAALHDLNRNMLLLIGQADYYCPSCCWVVWVQCLDGLHGDNEKQPSLGSGHDPRMHGGKTYPVEGGVRLCRNPGGPVFLVGAGVFTSPAFSLSSGSGFAAKPPGLTACMRAPFFSSG